MVGTKYKIGSTNSVLKPVSTNYFLKLQPLRTGFYMHLLIGNIPPPLTMKTGIKEDGLKMVSK